MLYVYMYPGVYVYQGGGVGGGRLRYWGSVIFYQEEGPLEIFQVF